ncbi:f-box-like domain-containing protein [Ditylenchus destructor]|nr:f-box-like domain-containing protein [Ditylenchus destructor]
MVMEDPYDPESEIVAIKAIFPDIVDIVNVSSRISVRIPEDVRIIFTLKSSPVPNIKICASTQPPKFSKLLKSRLSDVCEEHPGMPLLYNLIDAAKQFYDEWESRDYSDDEEYSYDLNAYLRPVRKRLEIEDLPKELLVEILEWLSPSDRINAERVNSRWRKLAKDHSWAKCSSISVRDFSSVDPSWKLPIKFLTDVLFARCGRFVDQIDFRDLFTWPDADIMDYLFSYLPNLQHIHTRCTVKISPLLAQRYPELKSLILDVRGGMSPAGVQTIFRGCQDLEFLLLYNADMYSFDAPTVLDIPPRLKCLQFQNCRYNWVELVLEQIGNTRYGSNPVQLESLDLDSESLDAIQFKNVVKNCTRLKYLSVSMYCLEDWHQFAAHTRNLANLRVLELFFGSKESDLWPNKLIQLVSEKCMSLEHISINYKRYPYDSVEVKNLAVLADLPKLCSVSIIWPDRNKVGPLFEQLSISGKLKYFSTNVMLPLTMVSKALQNCPNLTHLSCAPYNKPEFAYKEVIKALDKAHGPHTAPDASQQNSIRHINFYGHNRTYNYILEHPWAKFDEIPPSEIVNKVYTHKNFNFLRQSRESRVKISVIAEFVFNTEPNCIRQKPRHTFLPIAFALALRITGADLHLLAWLRLTAHEDPFALALQSSQVFDPADSDFKVRFGIGSTVVPVSGILPILGIYLRKMGRTPKTDAAVKMPTIKSTPPDALAMQRALLHHLHRLHSSSGSAQIRPKVDTSPPLSMFQSPMSIHYKPFKSRPLQGRPHSADQRPKSSHSSAMEKAEKLAQIRRCPSQTSVHSYNIHTISSNTSQVASRPTTSSGIRVGSKLKWSRSYQAPVPRLIPSRTSETGTVTPIEQIAPSENRRQSKPLEIKDHSFTALDQNAAKDRSRDQSGLREQPGFRDKTERQDPRTERQDSRTYRKSTINPKVQPTGKHPEKYEAYLANSLDTILIRGVFSDRVIEDCFLREMQKWPGLDEDEMTRIMNRTLLEIRESPGDRRSASVHNRPRSVRIKSGNDFDDYPGKVAPRSVASSASISTSSSDNGLLSMASVNKNIKEKKPVRVEVARDGSERSRRSQSSNEDESESVFSAISGSGPHNAEKGKTLESEDDFF